MTMPMNNASFFLVGILLPLVTLIMGFILWKNPTGINNGFGFRTKLSKSSEDAWYFAQKYSGKMLMYVSVPTLAIAALLCGICLASKINSDGKFGVILMIVIVGIIEIAAVNAVTDQKLKTSFKETLEKQLQKLSNDKEGRL